MIMPVLKDRHVVISRARNGREIYDTVCEWLNTTNYFKWTDDSVSYNNELEELDRKRRMLLLRRKISECGCVVLFAEMYGNYKEWIDLAIDIANEMHKPLIGVRDWDASPVPKLEQINCRVTVKCERNCHCSGDSGVLPDKNGKELPCMNFLACSLCLLRIMKVFKVLNL